MSELAKTIERLQLWIRHWQPHYPVEFIADLWRVLGTASAAQEAVEVLQRAQRYDLNPHGDFYHGEGMVHSSSGDWLEFDDVVKAIQILQEGQQ